MEIGEELDNLRHKMFITLGLSSSVSSLITSLSFSPLGLLVIVVHLYVLEGISFWLVLPLQIFLPICLPDHLGYQGLSPLGNLIFI